MENVRFHREDVEPDEVDNIDDLICQTRVVTPDDFLVDDDEFEDDTLEEYNDEEVEPNDDSDISSEEENEMMSSHGSAPLATSAASGSSFGDDRHDPKGKRVREETRGCLVEKELRRLKIDRLNVKFCEKTGKPIFEHGKMFLNILAKTVRDTIPASTTTKSRHRTRKIGLSNCICLHRGRLGNPETREVMSPIDDFESRHLKPSGWRNEYTQEKHLASLIAVLVASSVAVVAASSVTVVAADSVVVAGLVVVVVPSSVTVVAADFVAVVVAGSVAMFSLEALLVARCVAMVAVGFVVVVVRNKPIL
ncbi:hypothetical protein PanWU01x14_260740 [Parasponia andersonii]|uniref:Uncharacterized protein n=1 Tax=Parasponia andersonii TaxID=3476 RepID=A0A2P5B8Y8_PARAD|nr:hypothetical protein PanWU01x14_260740 [Parasponia andersonii]